MVQRCITGEVIAHSVFCLSIWFVSENNSISISSVYVDSYLKEKVVHIWLDFEKLSSIGSWESSYSILCFFMSWWKMAVHAAFEEINNKCLTKVWVSGQLKCNQVCPLYSNLLFWKVHVKLLSAFCPFQVFHFFKWS